MLLFSSLQLSILGFPEKQLGFGALRSMVLKTMVILVSVSVADAVETTRKQTECPSQKGSLSHTGTVCETCSHLADRLRTYHELTTGKTPCLLAGSFPYNN